MAREKGMALTRSKNVPGMVSAVLSDNSLAATLGKPRSSHSGACVWGVKEREKRGGVKKWLISFLSETKQSRNDETC